MLTTAHTLITRAGKSLGLDAKEIEYLKHINAEHAFDITLKSGKTHKAYRMQHNNDLGPYKGGIRFHPGVDANEVRALATLMSLKTAAVGLPLGGGKGGVSVDPKTLTSAELEELSRKYVAHLHPHIGPDKDVPAPDVNTDARIIDWMVDEYQALTGDTTRASFTGKSIAGGGSLGREAATGRGGVIALRELLKSRGITGEVTIAIQGFGNVGSFFGLIAEAEHPNWRLVAATDSSGGIASADTLSARSLDAFKAGDGRLIDYPGDMTTTITNDQLVAEEVDVLILAALGDVITANNKKSVHARFVLELANGPIQETAYDYLEAHTVTIVPDILANAGGVIVSYLEWLQNKKHEHWTEERVAATLEDYMVRAISDANAVARDYNVPLKQAAVMVAVRRILKK